MESEPIKPQPTSFKVAGIWPLTAKELRETLRDRRTLMTLLLMPILVYPLLGLMFQGFFLPTLAQSKSSALYIVAFESDEARQYFARAIPTERFEQMAGISVASGEPLEIEPDPNEPVWDLMVIGESNNGENENSQPEDPQTTEPQTLESLVANGSADIGARLLEISRRGASWEIVTRDKSSNSRQVAEEVTSLFLEKNHEFARARLSIANISHNDPIRFSSSSVESTVSQPISLVAIIPLILTLMTITGAVYPAIDLTAGERERGTLESLIAAPVPRMKILLGKFVAVIAVALLTAMLNILGMVVTLWVFQLDSALFGDGELNWFSFGKLCLLLVIFAAFFSSILLAVTSFARSFKEGQAYLIPIMLFSIGPSLLSLKPELTLDGVMAIAPLVNIVLLARDVLQGDATIATTLVAVGSTILYSLLALSFAAKVFGTDAVLYGSGGSWKEFLAPPEKRQYRASESVAMLCVALLLPTTFVWNGLVGRMAGQGIQVQFSMVVLGLFLVFMVVPLVVTSLRRVDVKSGYRLFRFSPMALLVAVILGVGLGPIIAEMVAYLFQLQEHLFGASNREELLNSAKEQVAKWRQLPWYLVIPGLSVVPAVVEEFFFRGCLFQALIKKFRPLVTILATAVIFGLFHLITAGSLGLSRFIPTTLMGIVLGWICYRSGSVIPGMILHAIHNAIIVSLANFRDELIAGGWLSENQESMPVSILAGSLILSIGGLLLMQAVKPVHQKPESTGEPAE